MKKISLRVTVFLFVLLHGIKLFGMQVTMESFTHERERLLALCSRLPHERIFMLAKALRQQAREGDHNYRRANQLYALAKEKVPHGQIRDLHVKLNEIDKICQYAHLEFGLLLDGVHFRLTIAYQLLQKILATPLTYYMGFDLSCRQYFYKPLRQHVELVGRAAYLLGLMCGSRLGIPEREVNEVAAQKYFLLSKYSGYNPTGWERMQFQYIHDIKKPDRSNSSEQPVTMGELS